MVLRCAPRLLLAATSLSLLHVLVTSVAADERRSRGAAEAVPVRNLIERGSEGTNQELAERVAVDVRVLSATDPVDEAAPHAGSPMVVDARIRDLTSKLEPLHYRTFRLQYEERIVLSLLKREKVSLKDGHELILRPVYLDGDRVGLWFRWTDRQGNKILDTRVHLTCGESIVAGTDAESGKRGIILALSAHPSR